MKEQWKDIEGYEHLYQVSSFGRIKSFNKWNGHKYIHEEKILKPTLRLEKGDYKRNTICLSVKNKRKHFKVHRLVAKAFIPNPDNKPEVNHIDSNALNNNVNNLEWVTHKENIIHSIKFGHRKATYDVENIINDYKENMPTKNIKTKHNITSSVLYNILKKNKISKHSKYDRCSIYKIPMNELLLDFKKGMRNVDIAKKYKTNRTLIGTYKYKFKKEGIL